MLSKKKQMRLLAVLLIPAVALIMGTAASEVWATGWSVIEYEDAECGFEVNLTDFDTGFRACVDAKAWKWLQIFRKGEHYKDRQLLFTTYTSGSLKRLGLTELCFESDEPFEKFQEILDKFPEGECKFIGKTVEHEYLKSTADLSHDFACAPNPEEGEITYISNDDSGDFEEDTVVPAGQDLVISWAAVTTKLEKVTGEGEFECDDPLNEEELEELSYQVVVETGECGEEDFEPSQSAFFDPFDGGTSVTIPGAFLKNDTPYKFELLVLLGGNRSIVEVEFQTGEPDCTE